MQKHSCDLILFITIIQLVASWYTYTKDDNTIRHYGPLPLAFFPIKNDSFERLLILRLK